MRLSSARGIDELLQTENEGEVDAVKLVKDNLVMLAVVLYALVFALVLNAIDGPWWMYFIVLPLSAAAFATPFFVRQRRLRRNPRVES